MAMLGNSHIGFLTTGVEVIATVIGAGIVIGGFVGAGLGVVGGRSRGEVESDALRDGFWGGVVGITCLIGDLFMRYAGL